MGKSRTPETHTASWSLIASIGCSILLGLAANGLIVASILLDTPIHSMIKNSKNEPKTVDSAIQKQLVPVKAELDEKITAVALNLSSTNQSIANVEVQTSALKFQVAQDRGAIIILSERLNNQVSELTEEKGKHVTLASTVTGMKEVDKNVSLQLKDHETRLTTITNDFRDSNAQTSKALSEIKLDIAKMQSDIVILRDAIKMLDQSVNSTGVDLGSIALSIAELKNNDTRLAANISLMQNDINVTQQDIMRLNTNVTSLDMQMFDFHDDINTLYMTIYWASPKFNVRINDKQLYQLTSIETMTKIPLKQYLTEDKNNISFNVDSGENKFVIDLRFESKKFFRIYQISAYGRFQIEYTIYRKGERFVFAS